MPLFEFVCQSCGKASELLVTGGSTPPCPHCGSRKLVKQLSSFRARIAHPGGHLPSPCDTGSCPSRECECRGSACPHSH